MLVSRSVYDINNWYWDVRDHQASGVFSSATMLYVPVTDPTYLAWVASGRTANPIDNEIGLWEVLQGARTPPPAWWFDGTTFSRPSATSYTADQLWGYSADARWRRETGGVTINDMFITTDLQSQAKLTGAYSFAVKNPSTTLQWKLPSGFVNLSSDEVIIVADGVGKFIEDCFAAEAVLHDQIAAGVVTTLEQIDAAYAAVTS
jgi:hypothetical protein